MLDETLFLNPETKNQKHLKEFDRQHRKTKSNQEKMEIHFLKMLYNHDNSKLQ